MLKKMLEIVAVAIIVAGVAGAYFRWIGALPIAVTQTQKNSTFDVTGEGKVVVAPDEASVMLGVRKQGSSVKTVQEQVNKTMTDLGNQLNILGIKKDDIKTSSYSFYPDYQTKGNYSAYAQVEVKVRDLDKVGPVLDLVGSLGLENVSGPSFGLSDDLKAKTMKEARAKAIDEAKNKAQELSGLAGMKLDRIVNIQEGANYPRPMMAQDSYAGVAAGAVTKTVTPVEPGTSEVTVNVTLSYETR